MSHPALKYGIAAIFGGAAGYIWTQAITTSTEALMSREEALTHVDERVRLAQCLTDKGYKLYGTTWCGWCKKQLEVCVCVCVCVVVGKRVRREWVSVESEGQVCGCECEQHKTRSVCDTKRAPRM